MTHEIDSPPAQTSVSAANVLSGVVRFLHVVRMRKGIVITALVISVLLSGLYYTTATRLYDSTAQLMVVQTGTNVLESTGNQAAVTQDHMADCQTVFLSDNVLEAAIEILPEEHQIDLKGIPRGEQTSALRRNTSVSSPRRTSILNIRYRSKDPHAAAAVVNSLLNAYEKVMADINKRNIGKRLQVLVLEKEKLEDSLRIKGQQRLDTKSRMQIIIDAEGKSLNLASKRVEALNEMLVEASQKTQKARQSLAALERAIANGEDILQFAFEQMETVGKEFLLKALGLDSRDGYLLAQMERQFIEDRIELNNTLGHLGQSHPTTLALIQKIQTTRQLLADRQRAMSENLRAISRRDLAPRLIQMARQRLEQTQSYELSILRDFERENAAALSLNQQMAQIESLDLAVDKDQQMLTLVADRIRSAEMNGRQDIRPEVIAGPRVSVRPVSPRLVVVALLGFVFGLGGALAVVYVLDTLDDRFRSPDELRVQLDSPVLAMVRELEPTGGNGIDAVHTLVKPNGAETEAFRTLRTALSFGDDASQRIVMTSTEPGDGKTTVLANLAIAFAQSGKRTLLIDADLRRPGMTALLEMKGSQGLSQVLRDDRSIEQSVADGLCPSGVEGLDVIPSGPRPVNPAELLTSDRFSELLAWAETVYDQILIDAPPVLAVSDPTIIGRVADGALLVVRPDKNRRRMVIRAVEAFKSADVKLLGVVVNHVTASSGGDYYGYGYGQGYGQGYGYDDGHDDGTGETGVDGEGHPEYDTQDSLALYDAKQAA